MARRIGPLPYRKVERALFRLGFRVLRQVGSHVVFQHADGRVAVVPHHARSEIGPGLVRRIVKDAGIAWETFAAEV